MTKAGSTTRARVVLRATAVMTVCLLAASTIGGCSSDTKKAAAPTGTPSATTTPTQTIAAVNPLTGVAPAPRGPVVAVKVDDTAGGRPSLGVDKADVIYIEEVEGGLTRMVAVFASAKPQVRAVRSIRSSDPELLGQYGKITVVASGGGQQALKDLDRSTLHSLINDRGQAGFHRDRSRPAPYNLVSDLAKVSAAVKSDGVRDVGFRWAAEDPRLAEARSAAKVTARVGQTRVDFVWDAKLARYVRTIGSRRVLTAGGSPVAEPNVLVQFCDITPNLADRDTNGNPTMFTRSVGSGRVVLFRDGKRIEGKWTRKSIGAPTTFTDVAGKPLLLAPGGTFVALARRGGSV